MALGRGVWRGGWFRYMGVYGWPVNGYCILVELDCCVGRWDVSGGT